MDGDRQSLVSEDVTLTGDENSALEPDDPDRADSAPQSVFSSSPARSVERLSGAHSTSVTGAAALPANGQSPAAAFAAGTSGGGGGGAGGGGGGGGDAAEDHVSAGSSVGPEHPPLIRKESGGILKLDPKKPRRSSGSSVEFRLIKMDKVDTHSPTPSCDRLSVSFAPEGGVLTEQQGQRPQQEQQPVQQQPQLSHPLLPEYAGQAELAVKRKTSTLAAEEEEEDDYSVSVSQILERHGSRRGSRRLQRQASSRESRRSLRRRRSRSSRNHSLMSGDVVVEVDESDNEEQIFENIRLHKEVIGEIKHQPWPMQRKLNLVTQAKIYVAKHEGELAERLAQSRSARDILARYSLVFLRYWQVFQRELANWASSAVPWQKPIKRIESHFGTAVASYFTFLRWILFMNIGISVLLICFVIIPEILAADRHDLGERKELLEVEKKHAYDLKTMWDFEGVLKYSPIFYGYYNNKDKTSAGYRIPFAYFLSGMIVYAFSFIVILKKMAENSRMSKMSSKEDDCAFTWKLFTGWDFMIGHAETALNKVSSITMGFRESLLEERERAKEEISWRTIGQRVLANFGVLLLLVGSAYAVILLVQRSTEPEATSWYRQNELTLVMTLISQLFPALFDKLGLLEGYHPRQQLRMQLARIMALNLLNLYTLIFALFGRVDDITAELTALKPNISAVPPQLSLVTTEFLRENQADVLTTLHPCYNVQLNCTALQMERHTSRFLGDSSTTAIPVMNTSIQVAGAFTTPLATSATASEIPTQTASATAPAAPQSPSYGTGSAGTPDGSTSNHPSLLETYPVPDPEETSQASFGDITGVTYSTVTSSDPSTALSSTLTTSDPTTPVSSTPTPGDPESSASSTTTENAAPSSTFPASTDSELFQRSWPEEQLATGWDVRPTRPPAAAVLGDGDDDSPHQPATDGPYGPPRPAAAGTLPPEMTLPQTAAVPPLTETGAADSQWWADPKPRGRRSSRSRNSRQSSIGSRAVAPPETDLTVEGDVGDVGGYAAEYITDDISDGAVGDSAQPAGDDAVVPAADDAAPDSAKAREADDMWMEDDSSTTHASTLLMTVDSAAGNGLIDEGLSEQYIDSKVQSGVDLDTVSLRSLRRTSEFDTTVSDNPTEGLLKDATTSLESVGEDVQPPSFDDSIPPATELTTDPEGSTIRLADGATDTTDDATIATIGGSSGSPSSIDPPADTRLRPATPPESGVTSRSDGTSVPGSATASATGRSTEFDTALGTVPASNPRTQSAADPMTGPESAFVPGSDGAPVPSTLPVVTTETSPPTGSEASLTLTSTVLSAAATGADHSSTQHPDQQGSADTPTDTTSGETTTTSVLEVENRSREEMTTEPFNALDCYELICASSDGSVPPTSPGVTSLPTESRPSPTGVSVFGETAKLFNNTVRLKLRKLCWETMYGQELVKLIIMDTVWTVAAVVGMEFFRAVFVRVMNNCWCWDLERTAPKYADFSIAENILHLVNNQGMIWMGMFFAPGLPAINAVKLVILMYVRAWGVLTSNVPHEVVFKASRSNNFYFALLLIMLFLCTLPVGYAIVWLEPSWHCGPFSGYLRAYKIFTDGLQRALPDTLNKILDYISSPAIVIPLLVLLVLVIFYQISLAGSLRESNNDLRNQLRRERTEERRKMFKMADAKTKEPEKPFDKWSRLLENTFAKKSSEDRSSKPPKTQKEKEARAKELLLEAVHRRRERIASQMSEQSGHSGQPAPQPPASQPNTAQPPPSKTRRGRGADKLAAPPAVTQDKSAKKRRDRAKSRSIESGPTAVKRDSTASSMSVPVIRISKEDSVELADEPIPQDSLRRAEPQEAPARPRQQDEKIGDAKQ